MNWDMLAIGDFCRTGSGGTPSRKKADRYFGGNIPWVKSGELREGVITKTEETITQLAVIESSAKFIPKGALLVAMYGATIGRVAKLGIDATSNQAVCHILPDESLADMQYVFYALQAQVPHWLGKGVGGAQPNISQEIIKNTVLPLPPLEEQRRIAAILDKAAKLKSMSNKAHQIIADARTSRLRDLLCGATAHQSAWERVPISELIRDQPNNGIFRKNHEYNDPISQGLPVIWVEQLFRGEVINTIGCRLLNASEAEVKKYGLFNGDILFCRSSLKPEGIAKPNIYTGDDNQALFECHLIRISPDQKKVNPIFLNECLNLPEIRREARRLSKTSTMTTIDQDGILAIKIPLPPLHVQGRFADEFSHFQGMSKQCLRSRGIVNQLAASLTSSIFGK